MFDEVNKAGKMLQERIAQVPPAQVMSIADHLEITMKGAARVSQALAWIVERVAKLFGREEGS